MGFMANAKEEDRQEAEAAASADAEKGTTAPTKSAATASVNLVSALLHVGADMMRSLSTTVEGTVLLFVTVSPETESLIDPIATMFICIVVYAASAYAFRDWIEEFKNYRRAK